MTTSRESMIDVADPAPADRAPDRRATSASPSASSPSCAILFLPIPPFLIDIGLAFSIALSVLILMVALWIQRPLDFSAFPTVLLIATMLRLSLNIATTRAHPVAWQRRGTTPPATSSPASRSFVMSGDFVIGLIVFVILITVNFRRHHQGRDAYRRGRRPLHARCHSRQADGDRRRSLGRA